MVQNIGDIHLSQRELLHNFTVTVHVRPSVRAIVGLLLVRFGAWLAGMQYREGDALPEADDLSIWEGVIDGDDD